MRWPGALFRAALGTAVVLAATAPAALAASAFMVNTTADGVDETLDGICATSGNACTLRAAVQEANALGGANAITVPAGTYRLTIDGPPEDAAATGDLDVTGDLTVVGASARTATVTAKASDDLNAPRVDRIFDVVAGGSLTLSKLAVQGGLASGGGGGGIRAVGALSLTDVSVADSTTSGNGGGIWSSAALDLDRVTIADNRAADGGGVAASGALTAVNTTVAGNHATNGGGIAVLAGGGADLTNVTLALNYANGSGGQLRNDGTVNISNSILEWPTIPFAYNCGGTLPVTGGHNVDDDGSCALAGTGDRGFDIFGWTHYKLVNGGGETDVLPNYDLHAFSSFASPALYAQPGPAVDIGAAGCPATDQRGVTRPQGPSCDAGAYEATFADVVLTVVGAPQQVVGGDPIRYSLIFRNDGPGTITMPALSGIGSSGAGFPIPSIGGSPCQYYKCTIGPLAPGGSATIDIEITTGSGDGPQTVVWDWWVIDEADASAWNIDPNPDNSKVHVAVAVLPKPTEAQAPQPQPRIPAVQPCAKRKTGTRKSDLLKGTAGGDLLRGRAGNDTLKGLAGDDCLEGGAGDDVLVGGAGNDVLVGGADKDKLLGGAGNDVISAADHTKDTVDCGKGRDRATVDKIDRVRGCEKVTRKR